MFRADLSLALTKVDNLWRVGDGSATKSARLAWLKGRVERPKRSNIFGGSSANMAGKRHLDGETVPQPDDVSMNASPKIKQTKLEKIRPTQMSVGFVEVAKKRRA